MLDLVKIAGIRTTAVFTAAAVCASLQGESIPVPNGSFESPVTIFVNTHVDLWQKTPKPADYDESGGYQWEQLAGVFTNTPPANFDHIDNCDLGQAIYVFAVPQIGIFQDYNSTDWSHTNALQLFDARFEPGKAYDLTVGVMGGGGGMLEGVGFDISLYYRDTNGTPATVAVTHITNSAALFPSHTHLTDFTASLPVVRPTDPWAGQHAGILLVSTATAENQGGYWDLDHVRLYSVAQPILSPPTTAADGGVSVSWTSDLGYLFQLQSSSDLVSWQDEGSPLAGTGSAIATTVAAPAEKARFFRVQAALAP